MLCLINFLISNINTKLKNLFYKTTKYLCLRLKKIVRLINSLVTKMHNKLMMTLAGMLYNSFHTLRCAGEN